MTKGISADSQVHISMIAAYYQIQMKFASIDRSVGDMHQELVVLSSKMNDIEKQHVEELEHHAEVLEEENRSLMQKLGLKR